MQRSPRPKRRSHFKLPTRSPVRSPTVARATAEAAAAELSATLKACTATVTRKVAGPIKLEEWRFPGDIVIIDVSMASVNNSGALELFRTRIANPLFAAGVVPLSESKTDLGSRCK